jgi:porin
MSGAVMPRFPFPPTRRVLRRGLPPLFVASLLAGILPSVPVAAQSVSVAGVDPAGGAAADTGPDFYTGLFAPSRTYLLNDMGGLRTALGDYGISFGLQETSEVLGNVTGGIHTGADYDGMTEMSVGLDTQKAFGWTGGIFNISALQIHGRNLSTDNLDVLQQASGIEADRSTRLWEMWYQQSFFEGATDIKIGQQSVDQEFMVSQYSSTVFMNMMMGWPMLPSADMYAGGPAYPLSSLGVRLRAQPTRSLTVLAGVFDDNPAGGSFYNDSEVRGAEAWGGAFNLNTGALWMAELQYAVNQPALGDMVSPDHPASGLPGTYKLGFWYDSGAFPDQQYDTLGVPLASPMSNGDPMMHRGNYSVYALADQMVWHPSEEGPRSVGVFARAMAAPPDRNEISASFDGGLVVKDPLPGRDNDNFGVGVGVAQVSPALAAYDNEVAFYTNRYYPAQSTETFVEMTYQYQIAPWWQVQPDFQYFFDPSGGIPNPLDPTRRIGNEAVFGFRTVVTF